MSGGDFATMGVMGGLWAVQIASWSVFLVAPVVAIVTTGGCLGTCEALRREQKRRIEREYEDYLNT